MPARFTIIRATKPKRLTKSFALDKHGKLVISAAANMAEGEASKLSTTSLGALASYIVKQDTYDWALCCGVPRFRQAAIVTKRAFDRGDIKQSLPLITRSKEHFTFSTGHGLLMLDYDPAKDDIFPPLSADELIAELRGCCPWLDGVGFMVTQSVSSHIYRANGEELIGARGLHVYAIIDKAKAIPRATDAIFQATFERQGYALITKSGSILPRSLIDRSVGSPERLIFECGAVIGAGLESRRVPPELFAGGVLAASAIQVDVPPYQTWRTTDAIWLGRKTDAEPEAALAREAWILDRLTRGKADRETLERALTDGVISNDFPVPLPNGNFLSVGAIRTNMKRYRGRAIPDPLEPDYDEGRLCAVIGERGIWSYAHGGYNLRYAAIVDVDALNLADHQPTLYY